MKNIKFTKKELTIEPNNQNVLEIKDLNKIPRITLNMMLFDDGGIMKELRDKFLDSISEIKKSEYAVIDISKNFGGDGGLVHDWFRAYTGKNLEENNATLRIRPNKVWRQYIGDIKRYDDIMKEMGLKADGHYYIKKPKEQFMDNNDTMIFLRTGRYTASAAEYFTSSIKNLSNVITIGSNTGGVYLNGSNHAIALPFSNVYFQFGECLFYFDENFFRESYGMEPDIWLTGANEEQRFNLFLESYIE